MEIKRCDRCNTESPFRKGAKCCVWCEYENPAKRARSRYRDIRKRAFEKFAIESEEEFVKWYLSTPDCCTYCGLTYDELRRLRLKPGGSNRVGWDIDKIKPIELYRIGNLAKSCFVCNMAKGDALTDTELKIIGQAVRKVWDLRLANLTPSQTDHLTVG